jgi:N-methylhydantoinase A
MKKYIVGIDVGGTFTDGVSINHETGECRAAKSLTTPEDQTKGVLETLKLLGVRGGEVVLLVHGYTVGINAVLMRTGAPTGLLSTMGHRDLLDQGRGALDPRHIFDFKWLNPHQERPMIERRYRRPIEERMSSDGCEIVPLNEKQVRDEVRFLKREGVKSIAICFINAYKNPRHEELAEAIVKDIFPEAYVTTSKISPLAKEYERTCTVVYDAYIGPLVTRYLKRLDDSLKEFGYQGEVMIVQMTGGLKSLALTADQPVQALNSGPVGGCIGIQTYGKLLNKSNLIGLDIGGTTTDTTMIIEGELPRAGETEVEFYSPVQMPLLKVSSVGSGGGSIVNVSSSGALTVGPASVGSIPGPACYNRGGTVSSMSDCYLLCGLLLPDYFAGGSIKLYPELSKKALDPLASRVGLSTEELATAAHQMMDLNISEAIRAELSQLGLDPREYSLISFGAAGPIHACGIARNLLVSEVIVPLFPGNFSALGMIGSDLEVDCTTAPMTLLNSISPRELDSSFNMLDDKAVLELVAMGINRKSVKIEREFYGMYAGQTWDKRVPVDLGPYDNDSIRKMIDNYHAHNLKFYGYSAEELPIMITRLVSRAISKGEAIRFTTIPTGNKSPAKEAIIRQQDIYLEGQKHENVPAYYRSRLLAGNMIEGPALIVEDLATTVVYDGCSGKVDDKGNLRITIRF